VKSGAPFTEVEFEEVLIEVVGSKVAIVASADGLMAS
jgi:hypothetical protein